MLAIGLVLVVWALRVFCFLFVGIYLLGVVYCLPMLLLVVPFFLFFFFLSFLCVCFVLVVENALCHVCGLLVIVVMLLCVGVCVYI